MLIISRKDIHMSIKVTCWKQQENDDNIKIKSINMIKIYLKDYLNRLKFMANMDLVNQQFGWLKILIL